MTREIVSTTKQDWSTPDHFFAALHAEYNYEVDLMAAWYNTKLPLFVGPGSPFNENVFALESWGEISGFCNPEYRIIEQCLERAVLETEQYGAKTSWLIPANTDTQWFHKYAHRGVIDFVKGRLKFEDKTPPDIEAARYLRLHERKDQDKKFYRKLAALLLETEKEGFTYSPGQTGATVLQGFGVCKAMLGEGWRAEGEKEKDRKDPGPGFPSMVVHLHPDSLDKNIYRRRSAKTGELL